MMKMSLEQGGETALKKIPVSGVRGGFFTDDESEASGSVGEGGI